MQSRILLHNKITTDQTQIHLYRDDDLQKIVFISYRRTPSDIRIARECAEMLEEIDGLRL